MKKFLFLLFFTIIILPSGAYASDDITITIPDFPVTVNGTVIDNISAEYPFIIYNDITYLPTNWNMMRFTGLRTQFDTYYISDVLRFFIGHDERTHRHTALIEDTSASPNNKPYYKAQYPQYQVYINNIFNPVENDKEDYPVLNFRGITYLPLTYKLMHDCFDWQSSFDSENGLVIDTTCAFRPVIDNRHLFAKLMGSRQRTEHVAFEDAYVGFERLAVVGPDYGKCYFTLCTPALEYEINFFDTLCDFLVNEFKQKSPPYLFINDLYNDNGGIGAAYPPQLDGNVLSIYACFEDSNFAKTSTEHFKNLLLRLDLKNGTILSWEEVPHIPYSYHEELSRYKKVF